MWLILRGDENENEMEIENFYHSCHVEIKVDGRTENVKESSNLVVIVVVVVVLL
jgi:hypothetical protein